jgi:type I restriction enzyme S subunit
LNQGILSSLVVPLPPLEEQRRIASILSAYDDLIEVNRRRVAILEEMARRLFEEWFVNLRFPGHEAVPVHDTPDGPLPEGWKFQPLHELARVNDRAIRPATAPTSIHYIDIASVSPGRVDGVVSLSFADAPGRARRMVQDGSVIWSTVRPNRRGFAIIFDPEPNLIVSTGFAVIDAVGVPASFLYAWITSDPFVTYLVNNATGAAYPAVTGATFERAQVLVPPLATVDHFGKVTDRFLRLADKLNGANARLAAARDLLLPRLVSGELSVAEAPEPERLLEAAD